MPQPTGVLSIQGDFEKHIQAIEKTGGTAIQVRTPEDLAQVDRLIIPGGESTTVGLLLERFGLGPEIQRRAADGMPVWGTCMGMIMMAHDVEGRGGQYTLDLLDVTVRRNAFGAQVNSFEDAVPVSPLDEPVTAVFIRAPIVTRLGEGVEAIAEYEGQVVAVRAGKRLGTSFHPELTDDTRLHEFFLNL